MMDHNDRDEHFHVFPSLVWDTVLDSLGLPSFFRSVILSIAGLEISLAPPVWLFTL